MRAGMRTFLLACAIAAVAGFVAMSPARAEAPLDIRWENLIPETLQETAPNQLMAKLLPHRQTMGSANVNAHVSVSPQADLVAAYNGQRVRITGFVVPFNNELPPYKRLLLIPFSGACVKFPPPRNQAILVSVAQGITLTLTDLVYPMSVCAGVTAIVPVTDTG